jgi:hypothetical protein
MIIDFKEIPAANKGNGEQDRFEQFACDFLETIGFKIIRRPDRGPDGKKDLIVSDTRTGVGGETTIKWIVSCKHNAHTGVAVKDTDEKDIYDRVIKHHCQGFLGFYSTLPASTLSDKLYALRDKIESITFDSTRIERELLLNNQKERILVSYFPNSHDKYRQNLFSNNSNQIDKKGHMAPSLTEEDVLRITKTAIILLEIEKIKEEYYNKKWDTRKYVLAKLYRFSDHSNEKVASAIFYFLESAAQLTSAKMPSDIASSIYSLVLTFFPSSYDNDEKERIENGKQCIYIGYILAYDAFIHLDNFRVAEYGLSIFKFIYREGKRKGMPELVKSVLKQYKELEQTLDRPERHDLVNAKELVKIFKEDLETGDFSFPVLPEHLYKLTLKDDENRTSI